MPRAQSKESSPRSADRTQPASIRGAQTRAKLLFAAKKVFERDGFLDARISDISKTAKVSYGAFYHYFPSKEIIFREVAQAQEERLTAPSADAQNSEQSQTVYEQIRQANELYLKRYKDEARIMGVIEQVSRYDADVSAARRATQIHFVDRSTRAIERLQKEGRADPRLDPRVVSDALGSMIARFAEGWLTQNWYPDLGFDDAVDQLTILWSNALGLAPEPTSSKP